MTVKTFLTDKYGLAKTINKIGWENVLQILPKVRFNDILFVIIYKELYNELAKK